MKPIPKAIRRQLEEEMPRAKCARWQEGGCVGRLTIEHTQGRRIQDRWTLLWECERHHLNKNVLKKDLNKHLAYRQATDEDFAKYPKSAPIWRQEKAWLEKKYKDYPTT